MFSKDDEGCIPAEEMKFVLSQVRILTMAIMMMMMKMMMVRILIMPIMMCKVEGGAGFLLTMRAVMLLLLI